MLKISTTLPADESQTLSDTLNHEIVEHGSPLAKLAFLSGEISSDRLEWQTSHNLYLLQLHSLYLIQLSRKLGFIV